MSYTFNQNKINALLHDFYESTGIAVGFYDANFNAIGGSNVLSPFCAKIKTNPTACLMCENSNKKGMRLAEKSRHTVVYTCHAGLVETITPVFYNEQIIAYMQTGQFIDKENVYSTKEKVAICEKEYSFLSGEILNLYGALPIVSKEKLNALESIMNVLIKSLWENDFIKLNRSALSLKIEKYLLDNIQTKISLKDVCERFYLSKNAVYHIFYQEFNTSFLEHLLKLRLEKAQRLLKDNKDLSVYEVSASCGFIDPNYFVRVFKKRLGITPLKFKKQI